MTRGRRTVALAIGVLLALALSEGVVRAIYWLPYEPHPRLGSVLRAGTTARYCREGCGASHWIAGGLRREAPLDPARPAVLALGDSFTEALMTDETRVYTRLAEERLTRAGAPLAIVNAGRSGTSTADYVALASYYAELVAPRWTVIQLRAPDLEGDAFDPSKTHFERTDGDGVRLVEVSRPVSRWNRSLAPIRRASALASFAIVRSREFAAAAAEEPPLFRATQRAPAPEPRSYPVEAQLDALAGAYGDRVTFLFLPEYDARDPGRKGDAERRWSARCAARGWSCANLRDRFAHFVAQYASPYGFSNSFFNSGHMNDAGHAAAAEVLFEELERVRARDLL